MTAAPSASDLPSSTRNAILAVVAGSLFVDMTVYGLVVPFLPLHAAEMGLSDSATGVLFASYAGALLAAAWGITKIVDRVDPRALLVTGLVGLVASTGAFWSADSFAGLIVARACQGAAAAAPWIVGPALVAECFQREARGRAMGITAAGSAVGTLVGPPLGGALYSWGGYGLPFATTMVATGLLAVAAALLLWRVPMPARRAVDGGRVGVLGVVRHPPVASIAAIVVMGGALLAMLEPVVPLLLARSFGADPLENGLLFGFSVLCYAIAAPLAGRWSDRLGRERVCAVGLGSCLLTLAAVAWAPSLWLSGAALGAVGVSFALVLTPTMPAMADGVDHLRSHLEAARDPRDVAYATVYVAYNAAYGVGMLIGPIGGSWFAQGVGAPWALTFVGVLCAVASLWVARTTRAVSQPGWRSPGR